MISIVVPTLNEVENIRDLIPEIYNVLEGIEIEVLVVDGHSTDGTHDVVDKLKKRYSGLDIMVQSEMGFANALVEGISNVRGGIIVTMDAENHMPSEILLLVGALIEEDADAVVGSRFVRGSDVELESGRFVSSKLANKIAKAALRLNVADCSSGFRVYRGEKVRGVLGDMQTKYFSVQVELLDRLKEAGGKIVEVPIHYVRRERGDSKFKFKPAIRDATTLLKIAKDRRIENIKLKTRNIKTKHKEIYKKRLDKLKTKLREFESKH